MAVVVTLRPASGWNEYAENKHMSASKWTVDERGNLHVFGDGTDATYAAGTWESARRETLGAGSSSTDAVVR